VPTNDLGPNSEKKRLEKKGSFENALPTDHKSK
jgi:hypothetical protein